MITLISGEPGNGKTALAVQMILEEMQKQPRPLFNWGVKELRVEHSPCPPLAQWTRTEQVPEDPSLSRAVFDFPSGSLIVIDEAQDVYRVRSASSKVPDHVAALETHRHQGLDFILTTQKPMQLDAHVRALVGRHIHLKNNWAGRKLYEWSEAKNPGSRIDCIEATTRKFKLPRQVFDQYKSATIHTRHDRRIPFAVWVVIGCLVILIAFSVYFYGRMRQRMEPTNAKEHSDRTAQTLPTGPTKEGGAAGSAAATSAPEVREYRLESYVYVAIGPRVIKRSWVVIDDKGRKETIGGYACRGEGFDAVCTHHGQEVRYQRQKPQLLSSTPPMVARVNPKR